ncbi:hypothetical protein [Caldivirga sp.]|uniref:hypothetical protein n=1 Tax=Caldivirga sp. TaxID=2080243 RepID=UPI0025C2BB83|nr:hypothetical protein [Caldivirga sp.]
MGRLRIEVNRLLQSEVDDIDGVMAIALLSTNGLTLGFVKRGDLNIGDVDLSLFLTLMRDVINRIKRTKPDSWFTNFKYKVITINGDQYSIVVINNNDLNIVAIFENSVDVNILMYRLTSDLELLRKLLSESLNRISPS